MSFISPSGSSDGYGAGSDRDMRGAREEALAEKRRAQRQAKDQNYDGVTERQPSLVARIKQRLKR
jgi:hypothetical protein